MESTPVADFMEGPGARGLPTPTPPPPPLFKLLVEYLQKIYKKATEMSIQKPF